MDPLSESMSNVIEDVLPLRVTLAEAPTASVLLRRSKSAESKPTEAIQQHSHKPIPINIRKAETHIQHQT